MFSFFKKKPLPPATLWFKTRVRLFWEWYESVADRFYAAIEAKRCPELADEVSKRVDEFLPEMQWVFGPGENNVGHSFTLTGEGVVHRQLLCEYWLSRAPRITGWTFYDARQPGQFSPGMSIEFGSRRFAFGDLKITPTVNEEEQRVNILAWHPEFQFCDEKMRYMVLFLFLDELLGERGTPLWIGSIDISDAIQPLAISPGELKNFAETANKKYGWEKDTRVLLGSVYQIQKVNGTFPRSDVTVGSTVNFKLIDEYTRSRGSMKNPLARLGAEFVFISFDIARLERGREAHSRGEIEDAISSALGAEASGRSIGGAVSPKSAYIDCLILDGPNSIDIIRRMAKEQDLPKGTMLHYFAIKSGKPQRII